MAASDPFATLGLGARATADDIRAARRRLAKAHHPDQGGDAEYMQTINEAADAALHSVDAGAAASDSGSGSPESEPTGVARDVPSFTVEALPVETFEAMLVVTS